MTPSSLLQEPQKGLRRPSKGRSLLRRIGSVKPQSGSIGIDPTELRTGWFNNSFLKNIFPHLQCGGCMIFLSAHPSSSPPPPHGPARLQSAGRNAGRLSAQFGLGAARWVRVGGSAPASCFSSLESTFLGPAAAGAGLSSSDAFLLFFSFFFRRLDMSSLPSLSENRTPSPANSFSSASTPRSSARPHHRARGCSRRRRRGAACTSGRTRTTTSYPKTSWSTATCTSARTRTTARTGPPRRRSAGNTLCTTSSCSARPPELQSTQRHSDR